MLIITVTASLDILYLLIYYLLLPLLLLHHYYAHSLLCMHSICVHHLSASKLISTSYQYQYLLLVHTHYFCYLLLFVYLLYSFICFLLEIQSQSKMYSTPCVDSNEYQFRNKLVNDLDCQYTYAHFPLLWKYTYQDITVQRLRSMEHMHNRNKNKHHMARSRELIR